MRDALPLLDSPDLGESDTAEVRAHAAGCPACAELLRAYEADERALGVLRQSPRERPAALAGFADAVMARLSEAGPAAPLPVLAAADEPAGKVIRFGSWPAVTALAAALLLALGLLIGTPRTPLPEPSGVARGAPAPAPVQPNFAVAPPAPQPKRQVPAIAGNDVPAPVRDPAPMPRRMRRPAGRDGEVVPVDGGRRRPEDQLGPEMRELLEKMAPQLQRLFPPPPPRPERKDEVRF